MKKKRFIPYILLLVILVLVFTSCKDDTTETDPETSPVEDTEEPIEANNSEDEDKKIMKEFELIKKDSPNPDVLIKFIDENIEKVSTENADEIIDGLLTSLENNKKVYEDRIFELDKDNELISIDGLEDEFKETSIDEIKNEKLKVEVDYLYSNMYKLINLEGAFYPIIDYTELKDYDQFVGEDLKAYIDLKSLESDNRSMADAGLIISFDELVERIFKAEDYLKTASDNERRDDILEDYDHKINAYLKGLPNTPIMDYETKKINKEVLESYKNTATKEYEFSDTVKEYIEIIESNKNIIDKEVFQEADRLIIKVLSTFEIK